MAFKTSFFQPHSIDRAIWCVSTCSAQSSTNNIASVLDQKTWDIFREGAGLAVPVILYFIEAHSHYLWRDGAWVAISGDCKSFLVILHITLTAQSHIFDILRMFALLFLVHLSEVISQHDNAKRDIARICLWIASMALLFFIGQQDYQTFRQSRMYGIF